MKYMNHLIRGMSVFAVLVYFGQQSFAGELHARKTLGEKDSKVKSSTGQTNTSDYIFKAEDLAKLQHQANVDTDKLLGFSPAEPEVWGVRKWNKAKEFEHFLRNRLADRTDLNYDLLILEAIKHYETHHDAKINPKPISPGEYEAANADGRGSFRLYANRLILEYRTEMVIQRIHQMLKWQYRDKILDEIEWPFNNVGGIYARLGILYCSTTEYLAFYATTTPQVGYSGNYSSMNVADIMFSGVMIGEHDKYYWPQYEGWSNLSRKNQWTYRMEEFPGMMDLGQGTIALNFWEGMIAPAIFVNHDFSSMETQMANCAKSMLMRAWHRLGKPGESVKLTKHDLQ